MESSLPPILPTGRIRLIAWGVIMILIIGDGFLVHAYWPNITEPPTFSSSTAKLRGPTTTPFEALPAVRRTNSGIWTVIGDGIEMIAEPAGSGHFNYRYPYTRSSADLRHDWQAVGRLRTLIGRLSPSTRVPPMGLSWTDMNRLKLLLAQPDAQFSEPTKTVLKAEFSALAVKAGTQRPNAPILLADERKLIADLNQAATADLAAGQPALKDRIGQIKTLLGDKRWEQISGEKPATQPATIRTAA